MLGRKEIFYEHRKKISYLMIFIITFISYELIKSNRVFMLTKDISYTIADSYIQVSSLAYKAFFLHPVFLIMLSIGLKNSFQEQFILRSHSKCKIWIWDFQKIFRLSFYVTLIESLTILGTGLISGQKLIDWSENEKMTFFRYVTSHWLKEPVVFGEVLFFFTVTTMLTFLLVGTVYLVLKDFVKNEFISIIPCVAWGILEWYMEKEWILTRLSLTQHFWLQKQYQDFGIISGTLLLLVIVSKKMAERREYY